MTLVVSVVTEQGIVLGADSLVGTPQGPVQDEKIWLVGDRFGVLSFGSGPPGVPAQIKAPLPTAADTQDVARQLLARLQSSVAPMYLHVAGFDCGEPQLLRVDISSGKTERINRRPEGLIYDAWCGGVASHPMALMGGQEYWSVRDIQHLSLAEAVWRTEGLIRRTVDEYPACVGLPVRILVLKRT